MASMRRSMTADDAWMRAGDGANRGEEDGREHECDDDARKTSGVEGERGVAIPAVHQGAGRRRGPAWASVGDSGAFYAQDAASEEETRRRTLWIGDLAYWMDEQYLYYAFASVYKTVSRVKIIRDRATGLNEGYGFVEFATPEAADFALQAFQGVSMPGTVHAFTLNWATPKSSAASVSSGGESDEERAPRTPNAEPASRRRQDGHQQRQQQHDVRRVAVSEDGEDAAFDEDRSETSDDSVSLDDIDDKNGGEKSEFSVFVGDLGHDVDDEMLCAHFKRKCSTAHNARIVIDLKTLRPKGYGFVDFKTEEDYQTALEEFSNSRCGSSNRLIRVSNALERRSDSSVNVVNQYHDFEDLDPRNTTIFVGNLDPTVSESTLRRAFEEFGTVAYAKVTPKKGCGFVHFFDRAEAVAAIENMHGAMVGSKTIRLSWGRHNATKCAISSIFASQTQQYQSGGPVGGNMYVGVGSPPRMLPVMPNVPAMMPGMRFPMTSAASMYSMYGGMHVMPPPPPPSLSHSF
jgi:RNA recognition motif-containing protein